MSTSRIRIISHSPLPIIKTWLPIPTNPASTLQDVSNSIADLLKTTIPFELELEGKSQRIRQSAIGWMQCLTVNPTNRLWIIIAIILFDFGSRE
jgi:hypothetical protein